MPFIKHDTMPRIHAYTDEQGVTQFCIDFPDGRRLLFAAHVTDFELNTTVHDIPLGLSDYTHLQYMGRRESTISLNAFVMERSWTRTTQPDTAPITTPDSTTSAVGSADGRPALPPGGTGD